LLDLRSIEAKVNQEIGKRNLSANLIQSNNDISTTLRQRKGQGGNPLSSINSCIGGTNNASSITLQNPARKRNTSHDNQRSNSQQQNHNHSNGSNSATTVGTSSFANSSGPTPSIPGITPGHSSSSSHISAQKEVIREQTASNWKMVTARGIFSIVIQIMIWPLLLYRYWNYTPTQKNEPKTTDDNQKLPDDEDEGGSINDSNSDMQENKESPVPGSGGSLNKTNKKNKGKGNNLVSTHGKKKISIVHIPSSKIVNSGPQSLEDVETSSTTTDASNDVDVDIGMNSSFSGKVSEIEDHSFEVLPGLSSTQTGNKKTSKKKKQPQPTNTNNSNDKVTEQSKKNSKGSYSKKELSTGSKNIVNNVVSEVSLNSSSNKEAHKKLQKPEEMNKAASNGAVKTCKQQAKVKPNEVNINQTTENITAGLGITSNLNTRTPFRCSDTSNLVDSGTLTPMAKGTAGLSTFGISTNGPLSSSGIFCSSDQPLHSTNHVLGQKTKKIPPPVGKILPEIKKPENKGAQYGPVGAKPQISMPPLLSSNVGCIPNKRSATPWNTEINCNNSIFEATGKPIIHRQNSSPVHNGSNSGMSYTNHPITSTPPPMPPPGFFTNRASPALQQQKPHLSNSLSIGSATVSPSRRVVPPISNINSNLGGLNNSGMDWNNGMGMEGASNHLQEQSQSSSWMIALQEERRRKTEEYLKQKGGDWPGFGSGPTTGQGFSIDDLWDDPSAASVGERHQHAGRMNTFNLPSFHSSLQQNTTSTGSSGTQSSWNTFNEVWPSSPADPYWTPSSNTPAARTGPFGSLGGGNIEGGSICDTGLPGTSSPNSSESSVMMQMMNNPSLSSIWSTPSTTSNDATQNVKSPSNDFSEPPPTSSTVPTSTWPMYQQNRNT
jgi:hypothetical protein